MDIYFGEVIIIALYLDILYKSFQKRWTYRSDAYILIFGTLIQMIVQINVWTALFSNKVDVVGVTLDEMIGYVFISAIVGAFADSNAGNYIGEKMKDGSIVIDFIRPLNLKYSLLAEDCGVHLYRFLFNVLPTCLFLGLVYRIHIPFHFFNVVLFAISAINGIFIIFLINYILGMLCFWLKDFGYIQWSLKACYKLFTGAVVPLWFYPGFLRTIANVLPFRLVYFEPISILLGKLDIAGSLNVLALQLIWIIGFVVIEKLVWYKAQEALIVFGG
ncbi:MAG: hypothetical protein FIA99_06285 [Ruminiclostridium sp.]|nr:hypothetical protein [Ruminiclostridium sp.]